jgi:hypothetical protein
MLVHSVYFWLKPDLSEAQRAAFFTALQTLGTVPGVQNFHHGRPAGVPPRPVVDRTFDHAITCVFADVAAHDAYQVHPVHLAFVEVGKPLWARVQIYDAE